jgi:putative DNA methylase
MHDLTFIETQFPVSKLSKESYKERKANHGQTLTGLGKWWGRKPLILVRSSILGLLMPASDDAHRDQEIFLKILTMDDDGLWRRKNKNISAATAYDHLTPSEREEYFEIKNGKPAFKRGLSSDDRAHIQRRAFYRLNYDGKLEYCARPEEIDGPSEKAWAEINAHLQTTAANLPELIAQLGERRFGHTPRVGDAFCGGGSIPFEAARIGCEAYGSDLSPVAALLTWAAIHIVGGGPQVAVEVREALDQVYQEVKKQIAAWGIERNERGWVADAYLYCHEVVDPQTGWLVPLAPSWVIGERTKTIARLVPDKVNRRFDIEIHEGVDDEDMERAKREGTAVDGVKCPVDKDGNLVEPHLRTTTSLELLRGREGLRRWENCDVVPRPTDVFQERLYCIRWVETRLNAKGEPFEVRHYSAPTDEDLDHEQEVLDLLGERFDEWQAKGYIPRARIESGYNTDQPIRERGYTHWHHLFNPRQLLILGLFGEVSAKLVCSEVAAVGCLLGSAKLADFNSRLVRFVPSPGVEKPVNTFSNQALNTLANYGMPSFRMLRRSLDLSEGLRFVGGISQVAARDARNVGIKCDLWITDPPYADAINYEELSEFFLSWYQTRLERLFPDWYADSKRALAVKGSEQSFRMAMVECYRNFADHMPDNGLQVVMFTHTNAEVWSDLALILWAAGLRVTAAWTIGTETDASGLKQGNYVQGTVVLILRKQLGNEIADLSDVYPQVQTEVERQLEQMLALEDKDDPNFSDSDLQLAAYAAALRVLTRYRRIEDIDVERELRRARRRGESSPLTAIIERAVKIASDYLVPQGIDRTVWRSLLPEERLYAKGIEVEAHGDYRSGVYMEFARGFGVRDYRVMLGSTTANQTRLKTPSEFRGRDLSGSGFASSLVRQILFAVHKTAQEEDPRVGRDWLRQEVPNYWDRRTAIIELLRYLSHTPSPGMTHWNSDRAAAELLAGMIENDGV